MNFKSLWLQYHPEEEEEGGVWIDFVEIMWKEIQGAAVRIQII